ncbi:MAG: hypothetical protein R2788_20235 [Saprospiraceae bacterium]
MTGKVAMMSAVGAWRRCDADVEGHASWHVDVRGSGAVFKVCQERGVVGQMSTVGKPSCG